MSLGRTNTEEKLTVLNLKDFFWGSVPFKLYGACRSPEDLVKMDSGLSDLWGYEPECLLSSKLSKVTDAADPRVRCGMASFLINM